MFSKLVITLAITNSVCACPSAKKANLRSDEINDYQRILSDIVGHDARKLGSVTSPMNAPQCLKPGFVLSSRANGATAGPNIRFVFEGVKRDFYQLIDSIINGQLINAPFEVNGADPAGLGAPGLANTAVLFEGGLNIQQQIWRVANILGGAARLAFHDAGEVDIRTLDKFGSDGCLSDSGSNSGLKEENTVAMTIIEPLWQKYCDKISRADFWVLFAKIALESGMPGGRFDKYVGFFIPPAALEPGVNPTSYLNLPFQYGRIDAVGNCDGGANRLPSHQAGLSEFQRVYVTDMGLTVRDGVILSGAHSVGHVHTQFSGFGFADPLTSLENSPLTNSWDESPWLFDNVYYDSLAGDFWHNIVNTASSNVIPNMGGTPNSLSAGSVPTNAGTNFWAVQIAKNTFESQPACSVVGEDVPGSPPLGSLPTCGLNADDQIFCTINDIEHLGPFPIILPNGKPQPVVSAPGVPGLTTFMDLDPLNPCNCASFFAFPSNPFPANCAMATHPKSIMLNADMVQNFPVSSQSGQNNVLDTPALNIGTGVDSELCGPVVTNLSQQILPRPPRFNTNQLFGINSNLVFPEPIPDFTGAFIDKGFGCVSNTIGDYPLLGLAAKFNQQNIHSSLLPKDPSNTAVSLWETTQSFMSAGLGGCVEGISTFNGHFAPYGGSIKKPLPIGQFIGDNAGVVCTDPTPLFSNGKDNFYREFEIAFTKMTTVGYTYSHTFNPPTVTTLTADATLIPPLVNDGLNGISVFIDPATKTAKSINMVASGNGKLGRLTNIDLGSSSCLTDYPVLCYPSLPSTVPTKAPISNKPTFSPSVRPAVSKRPTKAPISKRPSKAPVSKRPTKAPV